jgi:hypothetical protein
MIKRLKKRFLGKKKTGSRVRIKKASLVKRLQDYAVAATFAEAGLPDTAREILEERPKILVVGSADQFSDALIEYAIGLSKRMAYEIIALNCAAISSEVSKRTGPYHEKMFKNFRTRAAGGVRRFADRADEAGIPFRHVVEPGETGNCVRKMEQEISRLQFVLQEPESDQDVVRETSVPVFFISK